MDTKAGRLALDSRSSVNMLAVVVFIASALEDFSMHVTDLLFACIGCTVLVEDHDAM